MTKHVNDEVLGICMQAYYGGRAEIRIRHTPVPVVYTDFTSQYPTVNTLMCLWRTLIARDLQVEDVTSDVHALVRSTTIDNLFDPRTWPKLSFFAQIRPSDDMLPTRTVYSDVESSDQTNIGTNPLTSKRSLWFAGPDVVGSSLWTGRAPEIIRAIRFNPIGMQRGTRPVKLGSNSIDPRTDDFFQKVIEERKGKHKSDPLYYFLKILANAGCYGIYAELNRSQVGKNNSKQITIFSGDEIRTQRSCIFEIPGPWYFPISALITAGGRLLLAMLERLVTDAGSTYLMCDTDSMAIVASKSGGLVPCSGGPERMPDGRETVRALSHEQVDHIVSRFEPLNPYDRKLVPGSILNIVEEINLGADGKHRDLWGYGISAKRYALFTRQGSEITLVKASEHGLGLYYRPKEGRDSECDVPLWIKEGWEWLLNRALGLGSKTPEWFKRPVMRRIAISTPNVMAALRKLDRDQARPYNFAMSPVIVNLSRLPITLLGPFTKNSDLWETMKYVNIRDGSTHTLNPPTLVALPQTFEMVFTQYHRRPEFKSLAPDGSVCKAETRGLLKRYPVTATGFRLIGKETERGWEDAEDVSTLLPSLLRYEQRGVASTGLTQQLCQIPLDELERKTGLSRHTIVRARKGLKVHPKKMQLLQSALMKIQLTRIRVVPSTRLKRTRSRQTVDQ